MMFAVHIHRYIINEEDPGWVLFRFGRYELMYLLTGIVLFLCFALFILVAVVGVTPILGVSLNSEMWTRLQSGQSVPLPGPHGWFFALGVAVYCLFVWIAVRLVLMLPHAAVTGRLSFGVSWRAMKGNFWRFVLACILFALLVVAVVLLLSAGGYLAAQALFGFTLAPGQVAPEQSEAVATLLIAYYAVMSVVWGFYFVQTVALISHTYAYLIGGPGPAAAMSAQ
jgi:hypothetical protein